MVKRKTLGFKGGHNLIVTLNRGSCWNPKNISVPHIDVARFTWNGTTGDLNRVKKRVKEIRFYEYKSVSWGAQWNEAKKIIKININKKIPKEIVRLDLLHEMAHAWYNRDFRINYDAIRKWEDVVQQNLVPFTYYLAKFVNVWSSRLYANEAHSAITEIIKGKRTNQLVPGTEHIIQRLSQAYIELHKEDN